MSTCSESQFFLFTLPQSSLHAEILMRGSANIADKVLIGQNLGAKGE